MFEEILVCLDGSPLAEKILPVARAMTAPKGGKLTLLRVVADQAELAAEEAYLRDCARQYSGELRFIISSDPARAIGLELKRHPHAVAALTTHGRTAWMEAILGSVALRVVGESKRPVLLFRPLEDHPAPHKISTVAVALDGSESSEKIILCALRAAQSLSARPLLLQALPLQASQASLTEHAKSDVLESSYLHRKAADIKAAHGMDAEWEVLHGEPGDAICRYLHGTPDTLLAMTTRARSGVERAVLGSVAGYCVRHAGVPLLLYSPPRHRTLNKIGSGAPVQFSRRRRGRNDGTRANVIRRGTVSAAKGHQGIGMEGKAGTPMIMPPACACRVVGEVVVRLRRLLCGRARRAGYIRGPDPRARRRS
jgi:nucleotide-binding universal stress UspA family protein